MPIPTICSTFPLHHRVLPVVVVLIVLLGMMVPQADARHVKTKDRTYNQVYDQVQSVDNAAHTVTIATISKTVDVDQHFHHQSTSHHKKHASQTSQGAHTQKVVTLRVTNATDIEVNGQKRDFSALSKGMKVDVSRGTDETEATRLVIIQ